MFSSGLQPDSPELRILHLSDVHMDPDFAEGTVVNCDEPLCCRPWSQVAQGENVTEYSGKWGGAHGNCDLPQITLENMLEYIVQNIEASFFSFIIPKFVTKMKNYMKHERNTVKST